MTPAGWISLAERCEAATGPDANIDAAIMCALGYVQHGITAAGEPHWCKRGTGLFFDGRITASMDAISQVVIERFGGFVLEAGRRRSEAGVGLAGKIPCKGATPALALCASFCRATADLNAAREAATKERG